MEEGLVCKDLLTYLQDLPAENLLQLYTRTAPCLAVFRELPVLCRHYVLRLLFVEQPLPLAVVLTWPQPDSRSQSLHREAVAKLQNLRVWESVSLSGAQQGVVISDAFKRNMRVLLCGGGTPWAVAGHLGDDKHARDITFLDSYADTQWEGVLNFMVGGACEVTRDTVNVLLHAGLMASPASGHGHAAITTRGFQFLLLERSAQVWYFILQYLAMTQACGRDLVDCLTFVFLLSFLELGKDYSTDGLTESQVASLQEFREFGLVYQRKRKSRRYYPTKLTASLVSGSSGLSTRPHMPGFVVLETNYRVLAYTDSQLQIAILALFCQLQYRFPNLVVGVITRESIHQALVHGIKSEQVLNFLELHAHPKMLKNSPVIPPTVSDQVRLWEIERNRLEFTEGALYSEFLSASDFETVRKYAEDLGVLLWSSAGKRLMVVTPAGHDEVRRFWRRQQKGN